MKLVLPRLRKVWLKVHLYIGLALGLFIAVIGLSGSLLVFQNQLMALEYPHLFRIDGPKSGGYLAPDKWIERVESKHAGLGSLDALYLPNAGWIPSDAGVLIKHIDLPGGGHHHGIITVSSRYHHGESLLRRAAWLFCF